MLRLNAETGSKYPVDVAMLTDVVPSGANWAYYANRVKKLAQLRAFSELSERMHEINIENIGEKLNEFSSTATMIAQSIGGNVKSARDFLCRCSNQSKKP